MFAFPPLDLHRFEWRQADDGDSTKYVREIAGSELAIEFYNRNQSDHVLFLGAHVDCKIPLPDPLILKKHARQAWAVVRRKVPTVAAGLEYDAAENPLLTYRVPTREQVDAWLDRTVRLEQDTTDVDVLRTRLSELPAQDDHGDLTWIYLVPQSETSFSLLLHTHHVPFDATAGYLTITYFLKELAQHLSPTFSPSVSIDRPWGEEINKLCPCAATVSGPEEAKQGDPRYDMALGTMLSDAAEAALKNGGLRLRTSGIGRSIRLERVFTEPETESILSALRKKGFTLNQGVHGALTLMVLRDNPPPEDCDSIIAYYALFNARERLSPPYNTPTGFVAMCTAMSIMKVPVRIVAGSEGANDQTMLLKISEFLKGCYQKQKSNPALLSALAQAIEYMITPIKEALRSGGPLPPPWAAPWWSGDGIIEKFLDQEYADSTGKLVMEVSKCFVSVNRCEPAPSFRCHSWRGQLYLSVDYNEKMFPREDMEHIMNEWKRLILLFIVA